MANSDKNIRITTSRNKSTFPNIVFTGSAAGSSVITLNILDDNTMSFESNEGQVFSLDSNLTTGTIWGVSDVSGIPLLRASAGATIGIAEYSGSFVGIGTNIPTYKLHVRGLAAFASTADQTLSFIVDTSLSAGSANFQVRRGNSIRFYSSGDSFYTAFVSSATGNTVYTLPATSPQSASGTSVLSSTIAGVMSWVPMTAGGGSGSVNSGTAGSAAFYAADGTAVSGTADIYISSGNGITVNPVTNSTSTTTGALVVKGGVGVGGTISVGQRLTVGSSLNSTSTSTGALVNSGGLGLAGNAFIGGTVTISDTTNSTSSTTGSLVLTGGVGVGGTVSIGQRLTIGSTLNSTSTTTGAEVNSGGLGLAGNAFIGGTVTMTDTTNSTSSSTGSLVLSGGVGIAGTISVGQRLTVGSTLNSTSTTTGAEVNSGGLGLAGNAFIGGTVTMTNTTNSTSSSTGSLVLSGGAGIAGTVFLGGTLSSIGASIYGIIYTNSIQIGQGGNNINFLDSAGSTLANINTSNGWLRSAQTTESTSTTTGALVSAGGLGVAKNAFFGGTGSSLTVNGTNNSTNTITGALVVAGGLGLAGNAFIGGTVTLTNTTVSTSSSTGALVLSGSAGVAGTVSVGQRLTVGSTLNSTSTTTGAEVNSGGLGLAGNAFIGGTVTMSDTTNSISSSTGSLVLSGGAGVALSASIGGRLQLFNGANYTAFVSSASGNTVYTLPATSPQSALGTSVLSSTIAGVMSWVGMAAGGSATPSGSNTQIQFNDGGSFAGAVGFTYDKTNYIVSVASTAGHKDFTNIGLRLINNNVPTGVGAGGAQTHYSPTFELVGQEYSGVIPLGGRFVRYNMEVRPSGSSFDLYANELIWRASVDQGTPSYETLLRLNYTNGLGIGGSSSTGINFFKTSTSQSTTLTYTLPTAYPSTGTSVLSSDTSGSLTWVPLRVNSGTAGSVAFYAADGTTVSGTADIYVSSGNGITINPVTNSTSTTTGALVVKGGVGVGGTISVGQRLTVGSTLNSTSTTTGAEVNSGGLGLAGNAFIGGTVTITNTTNSTGIDSGALVVSGGAGFGKTIKVSGEVGVHNGFDLRVYSSGNAGYFGLNYTGASSNKTYTWPSDTPTAVGTSVLSSSSAGVLSWVGMAAGGSATKRHRLITLAAGYTPATGTTSDDAVYRLPFSPADGTTSLTYNIREAFIRTETPSAGISTVQIEYNTGTGVFDPPTGVIVAGIGLSVGGAGIAESVSRNFNISQLSSGTKLRLRFGTLDSTHSDFLITLLLEEN